MNTQPLSDTQQNVNIDVHNDNVVTTVDTVEMLGNLESMIKQHVAGIEKGREELKKFREMMSSVLLNDETYQEQEKLAKEAAKIKATTKTQLMRQQSVAQTVLKAKELSEQIKEMEEGLSDYLREYQRLSGSTTIETDDGEVRDIVYIAKLVKRSASKKR